MLKILDNYLKQRYANYMPNICQRYARSNSEATNSRQLPKAKICQRYYRSNSEAINSRQVPKAMICLRHAKDMQKICEE